MLRYQSLIVFLLLTLFCLPAGAQQDVSKEDALRGAVRSLSNALADVEDDSQAVMLLENFLDGHPDTKYTAPILDAIVYYVGDQMGDEDRAIAIVKKRLPEIADPENLKSAEVVLAGAYNEPRYGEALREQVKELEDHESLSYDDYETLIDAAFGAEDWDLAIDLCAPAGDEAGPDEVKAEYPGASDEIVKERSERRTADVEMFRGWGLANTGELDKALTTFGSAERNVAFNYFGIPANRLYLYWGKTLLMDGDRDGALNKLLPMALWGEDEDAVEAVKEIVGNEGMSQEEFEKYLYGKRREQAKRLKGFTAVDYADTKHESSRLMGKATLLAFWFPT